MTWLATVTLGILLQGAPAGGATPTSLLAHAPVDTVTLAVVDHRRLSPHPAYDDVLRLLYHRGLARGIASLSEAGLSPSAELGTTIGFRTSGRRSGEIFKLPEDGFERVVGHLTRVGKGAPERGGEGKRQWVRWDKKQTLGLLDEGGCAVFGPHELVLRIQGLKPGGTKTIKTRPHYRQLLRSATKGRPSAWGLSWDGTAAPDRPTHGYLRVTGEGDLDVVCVAYTRDEASARSLATRAEETVDRRIVRPPMMRALGISWLGKQLKVVPEGKRVDARIRLMKAQVKLLAQMGPQVLMALGI
ncbi:MAG: hypothetical protein VYE15_03735 [Myxococcota bacterium]|nr:hypothetical protein [Myxococcota bacterium]